MMNQFQFSNEICFHYIFSFSFFFFYLLPWVKLILFFKTMVKMYVGAQFQWPAFIFIFCFFFPRLEYVLISIPFPVILSSFLENFLPQTSNVISHCWYAEYTCLFSLLSKWLIWKKSYFYWCFFCFFISRLTFSRNGVYNF